MAAAFNDDRIRDMVGQRSRMNKRTSQQLAGVATFTSSPGNDVADLINLAYNAKAEALPFAAEFSFDQAVGHVVDFKGAGWNLVKYFQDGNRSFERTPQQTFLIEKDGAWGRLVVQTSSRDEYPGSVGIKIASPKNDAWDTIKDFVGKDGIWVEEESVIPNEVTLGFWSMSSMGPALRHKRMVADTWSDIKHNYATTVNTGLEKLMQVTPDKLAGKMLLLHGAPGTGKTRSLRTLALSWKDWCDVEVVVDPERLFSDSDYLMTVIQEYREDNRWTFLLLEDCDELISSRANLSGQAFSRLLNATDGFLGHGLNLLVGITTNEPIDSLHAAVLRSGRCLAKLEVPALPEDEARAWIGDPELAAKVKGETTLADLYALKNDSEVITDVQSDLAVGAGQYL